MSNYVEPDCVFEHADQEGVMHSFESGGAVVTPSFAVAYTSKDGILTDWHGHQLGTWRIVATWQTPRSYFSGTMSQIEATIDGITYTGRGAGVGCVWRGRAKRS